MEKDFDFKKVGKQMPYRTPEGFFERMQAETMERVEAEKRRKRFYRLKIGMAAVLGAAAVWCGVAFFAKAPADTMVQPQDASEWLADAEECEDPFCIYLQQLTDEELEDWIEFSENDIFMYENEVEPLN